MIPVPPNALSEATVEHAAATSRKSPRLINGYFIESQTGYSHTVSHFMSDTPKEGQTNTLSFFAWRVYTVSRIVELLLDPTPMVVT